MTTESLKSLAHSKFTDAECVVIKIGSALLVDMNTNLLRLDWLKSVAFDVNRLRSKGKKVVIVSSGSIAMGRKILKLKNTSLSLEESQAAAAVGQIFLAQSYQKCLEEYRFGDNDRLAAQVASLCDGNILVLLSDVDGLYTSDPNINRRASHIAIVEKITDEIEMMADDKKGVFSKGGMRTKLEAAKVSLSAGCHMVIGNGSCEYPISSIANGKKSTWFLSSGNPIDARKQWIYNTKPKGEIFIDLGAQKAIANGKSLLPAGVIRTSGEFARGDTVALLSENGKFLARGLIGYNYTDVNLIKGCHSSKIKTILGHPGRTVLIHRNDMTL